uniref:DUF11 domain-containing protein n=1 Tax=uncultured Thiotrichaceae bacterium TaxID=298394 RepID=A0A6S6UDU4_9GAMM|nr:MAG: Unknown protein [uncultured Thiotrichaceae bacterium]
MKRIMGGAYLYLALSPFVMAAPNLDITKTVDQSMVMHRQTVEYIIQVENMGDTDATGVQITDQLPSELTYIGDDESDSLYDAITGVWDVGMLSVGQLKQLRIWVVVN